MKKAYTIIFLLAVICSTMFLGCQKTEEETPVTPPPPAGGEGVTGSFTSVTNGTVAYDNFSLIVDKGDVPTLTSGDPGTVTFSMNTSSTIESGYPSIPSGYTIVSKYLKAGPESFTFNAPIQIYFPAASQPSPQGLMVLNYRPETSSWKIITVAALDTVNKKVAIDVLTLGYYVLVKSNNTTDASDFRQGGCVFDREDLWTNYILTVKSAALEKPEQLALFANGFIGGTYTGPIFLGCPNGKTKAIVPQGIIEFWVSYSICNGSDQRIYTYSLPATVTVSDPLNFIGWSTYDAVTYVPFTLPVGGTWVLGRPSGTAGSGAWPPATVPYGSGVFQATLTWLNVSGTAADMDLHLYGPNALHIYYGNRTNADFSLDRDFRTTLGNATENIYSLRNVMPSGEYTVKVVNYSGNTMAFNTRVVLNGASTNYSGSLSATNEVTVRTLTIP